MSKGKDSKRKLKRRRGFSTSPSRSAFPANLLHFVNKIAERESESERKRLRREERRKQREAADEKSSEVITIAARRQWLHRLRMAAGQDEALMDYRVIDGDLDLDWEYLLSEWE